MVGVYINIPSQVMRIVQLKPSNDMNPNLRYRNNVSLKDSSWSMDPRSPSGLASYQGAQGQLHRGQWTHAG